MFKLLWWQFGQLLEPQDHETIAEYETDGAESAAAAAAAAAPSPFRHSGCHQDHCRASFEDCRDSPPLE